MATDIDICNLALARLGDRATVSSINPPEGSAQADHCARFYPIARDAALSVHPWRFATVRKRLAKLSAEPPGSGTENYFALPSDCLQLISVQPEAGVVNGAQLIPVTYVIEQVNGQRAILANAPSIWCKYVTASTPPSLFSAEFADALAWLLASYLAGPLITGSSGSTVGGQMYQMYQQIMTLAIAADVHQLRESDVAQDPFAGDAFSISAGVGRYGIL
jgi:hypothetical protein